MYKRNPWTCVWGSRRLRLPARVARMPHVLIIVAHNLCEQLHLLVKRNTSFEMSRLTDTLLLSIAKLLQGETLNWRFVNCTKVEKMTRYLECLLMRDIGIQKIIMFMLGARCWWRSWLRHCTTSRKVAGSIPDGVTRIFHWHNPSGCTMALGLTQPLQKWVPGMFPGG
jgi:hypothetical protein